LKFRTSISGLSADNTLNKNVKVVYKKIKIMLKVGDGGDMDTSLVANVMPSTIDSTSAVLLQK
jgi:hypothetical protein